MSHVVDMQLEVNDLERLREAGQVLGLELRKQSTYRWYGTFVGDSPLPAGVKKQDLGKCDYVLAIPGNDKAYEVGVVKRKDAPGYRLLWDFWAGGHGLEEAVGKDGHKLHQEYSIAIYTKEMRREGFRVRREIDKVTQRPVMVARRGV